MVASEFDIDLNDNPIEKAEGGRSSTIYSREGSIECQLEDFVIRKVIGKGAFGKVFLVENRKEPGEIYAMKSIRKDKIIELEQLESTKLEKHILGSADHPFIVKMHYVFQNEVRLYFVMDLMKGGELFNQILLHKRFPVE